jgi:hypothetical protein
MGGKGWADTFTFDQSVQDAVNDRYIADKFGTVLPVLERLAEVRVKEGLGKGLADHGLPSNLIALPANWMDIMSSLMGAGAVPAAPAAAAQDTPLRHY